MDGRANRSWRCYPRGLEPSRPALLRALGAAAGGLAVPARGQQAAPDAGEPSSGGSAGVAEALGGEVRRVPVKSGGGFDLAGLKRAVDRRTRRVYAFAEVSPYAEARSADAVLTVDEAVGVLRTAA